LIPSEQGFGAISNNCPTLDFFDFFLFLFLFSGFQNLHLKFPKTNIDSKSLPQFLELSFVDFIEFQ